MMRLPIGAGVCRWLMALIVLGLWGSQTDALAQAAQPLSAPTGPVGTVDSRRFVDLAGADGPFVQIDIRGPLLKALSRSFAGEDEELAAFLKDVEVISSVVVEFSDPAQRRAAGKLTAELERDLEARGWQRLAFLRDGALLSRAFVFTAEDEIRGLVVASTDRERLIFSNIAGRIDLGKLARLSTTLTIPGLQRLPDHVKPPSTQPATQPASQDLSTSARDGELEDTTRREAP